MTIATMLSLGETALKLGLICSLTVLALFLSYSMLNVCDLSTDGCFTFGAAVGAASGCKRTSVFVHCWQPWHAGVTSGFVTGYPADEAGSRQPACRYHCKYRHYIPINIAVMGGSSLINMNRTDHGIYHDEGCSGRYTL